MDILLIEYDYDVQTLLKTFLESRGHQVVHYEDAESGWAAYQNQSYPLVIVDCSIPGGDGIEFCQKIRGTPKGFESMILVVTVRTRLGNLGQVLAAGADDYLEKPIDLDHLSIRLAIAELRVNTFIQHATNIESQNANNKLSKETGHNLEVDSIDLELSEIIEMAHKIGIHVIAERAGTRRANRTADRRQM